MCSCDFDEGPSTYTETIRRAKKEHRCCECTKTIKPGMRYEYIWGIWEGESSDFKTCLPCVRWRKAHHLAEKSLGNDQCYAPYGGLSETIRECKDDDWERKYGPALKEAYRKLSARAATVAP